jgi:hypothetical protein
MALPNQYSFLHHEWLCSFLSFGIVRSDIPSSLCSIVGWPDCSYHRVANLIGQISDFQTWFEILPSLFRKWRLNQPGKDCRDSLNRHSPAPLSCLSTITSVFYPFQHASLLLDVCQFPSAPCSPSIIDPDIMTFLVDARCSLPMHAPHPRLLLGR